MKIAILTLRVDNNYGGHLQRYALTRVLRDMGHEVSVLYFRSMWVNDSIKKRIKVAAKNLVKALLGRKHNPVLYWKHEDYKWEEIRAHAYPFFERYVKHTPLIYDEASLRRVVAEGEFDAFIVGSDQVWRKRYTERWGVTHFFLDFAPDGAKKIAYAASFGLPDTEYDERELQQIGELYRQFSAVSVRENSGLDVLAQRGWTKPQAELVLDPTMLLPKKHYIQLIESGNTISSKGDMFCYILDRNEELDVLVDKMAREHRLTPFYATIEGENRMSVEQWLRSYTDAKYVVTNSYHGVVFALIFNKPFYLIENKLRGNARFESLKKMFGFTSENNEPDWSKINNRIDVLKNNSMSYLCNALR